MNEEFRALFITSYENGKTERSCLHETGAPILSEFFSYIFKL